MITFRFWRSQWVTLIYRNGEPSVVDEILLQELLDPPDDLLVGKQPAVQGPRMGAGPGPLPATGALVVPAAAGNLQKPQDLPRLVTLADEVGGHHHPVLSRNCVFFSSSSLTAITSSFSATSFLRARFSCCRRRSSGSMRW